MLRPSSQVSALAAQDTINVGPLWRLFPFIHESPTPYSNTKVGMKIGFGCVLILAQGLDYITLPNCTTKLISPPST